MRINELFAVDVERNYIKITPLELKPRYTAEELRAIDKIVGKEKGKGKAVKAGKEFSSYIKNITAC